MTTETKFWPFEIDTNAYVGTILSILAVNATVPDQYLPARVHLSSSWRQAGGGNLKSWYAHHDEGMISFPTISGDGTQSLQQVVDWLEKHSYHRTSDLLDFPIEYARA